MTATCTRTDAHAKGDCPDYHATCYCSSPVCEKPHSYSAPVVMRLDWMESWYALAALMRWETDLNERTDAESTLTLRSVKRAIGSLEAAMFRGSVGAWSDR